MIHFVAVLDMLALAIGQILLKTLATYIGAHSKSVFQFDVALQIAIRFSIVASVYCFVFLCWMYVLRSLDLNRAFLYNALTFVFVPLLSYFFLGEIVRPATMVGTAVIIFGICVSFA